MTEEDVTKMGPLEKDWYMRIIRLLYNHPTLGPRGNEFVVFVEQMRRAVSAVGRAVNAERAGDERGRDAAIKEAMAVHEVIPKWAMEDFENGNHNRRRTDIQSQVRN